MPARTSALSLSRRRHRLVRTAFRALNELSLTVDPGEMRAIIGPNGGRERHHDGTWSRAGPGRRGAKCLFDGTHRLTELYEKRDRPNSGSARKFQEGRPCFDKPHGGGQSPLGAEGRSAGRRRAARSCGRDSAEEDAPHRPHIPNHQAYGGGVSRIAGSLAHGQKQWLEIGHAGSPRDPKLLLVDEPVAGMTDAESHQNRRNSSRRSIAKHTVVVVEHDMAFCAARSEVKGDGAA